jgi:hypothetical protein
MGKNIFSGPAWEQLKAERESGYKGWLDQDGKRVSDKQLDKIIRSNGKRK